MKKTNTFRVSERWVITVLVLSAVYCTLVHPGSETAAALCVALLVGWTQASDVPAGGTGSPAHRLSSINDLIEQSPDTSVAIEELCRVSCESVGASRVTLWSVERETGTVRLRASYPGGADFSETAAIAPCDSASALFRRMAEGGAPCAYTRPEIGQLFESLLATDTRSVVVLPVPCSTKSVKPVALFEFRQSDATIPDDATYTFLPLGLAFTAARDASSKELIKQELGKLNAISRIMSDVGPQARLSDVREDVMNAAGTILGTPLVELMTIDPFTGEIDCGRTPEVTDTMHDAFMVLGESILTDRTSETTFVLELSPTALHGNDTCRLMSEAGIRGVIGHPIRSNVGVTGALVAYYTTQQGARENEHLMETIATQAAATLSCALAIEQSSSLLDDLAGEYQELSVQASVDGLTGLVNHRTFHQKLGEFCRPRSIKPRAAFCLVMADVDHFKVYNDTHGHQMGDMVLRNVARLLSSGLRQTDFAARYGGEEFALVIKGVDKSVALSIADRIRRSVSDKCESLSNVTISMGLAEFPTDGASPREIIERADKALYRAKAEGRNRVVAWGSATSQEADDDASVGEPGEVSRSILVVEDLRQSQSELVKALKEHPEYTVEQVADIGDVVNLLSTRSFDVTLVATEALPDGEVEGLEDVSQIHPRMLTILVTSDLALQRNREAMRCGAYDIVVRPFTPAQLLLAIERNMERRRLERRRLTARSKNVLMQAIDALVAAVDSRDHFTVGHSDRVTELALGIADDLNLPQEDFSALEWVAKLYNIGRLALPDSALNKGTALNDEEWAAMRQHPILGSRIVGAIDELAYVSTIIRHHHERLDGTGYPDGLRGAAIPYLSKVIAVADAYAAMTSDRSFRGRMTPDEAMRELTNCAGKHYEPDVVEALRAHLAGTKVLSLGVDAEAA